MLTFLQSSTPVFPYPYLFSDRDTLLAIESLMNAHPVLLKLIDFKSNNSEIVKANVIIIAFLCQLACTYIHCMVADYNKRLIIYLSEFILIIEVIMFL